MASGTGWTLWRSGWVGRGGLGLPNLRARQGQSAGVALLPLAALSHST